LRFTAYLLAVLFLKTDVTTSPRRNRYPLAGLPSKAEFPPAELHDLAGRTNILSPELLHTASLAAGCGSRNSGTDELISMDQKMIAMTTKAGSIRIISFRSSESFLFFVLGVFFIFNGMNLEILSGGETHISL
jgi:hypothetical protein